MSWSITFYRFLIFDQNIVYFLKPQYFLQFFGQEKLMT